jgi:hypothetical protein
MQNDLKQFLIELMKDCISGNYVWSNKIFKMDYITEMYQTIIGCYVVDLDYIWKRTAVYIKDLSDVELLFDKTYTDAILFFGGFETFNNINLLTGTNKTVLCYSVVYKEKEYQDIIKNILKSRKLMQNEI